MRFRADLEGVVTVWNLVTAHNLSAGGALFTTDENVRLNDQMWIKIHFLDRVIECKGRVVRQTPGSQRPLLQVGVIFEEIQKKDKEYIELFCASFKQ